MCLHAGAAQFESCHNSTGCGGNVIAGVSNARDCCLENGLSFKNNETCQQCTGKHLITLGDIVQVCYARLFVNE